MGAALAFYSAFSLAPLLIIVIAIASAAYGEDAARGAIVAQLGGIVGVSAAQAIQALLKGAQETTTGIVATTIGAIAVLVGATTVLVELQDDLDRIWKAPPREGSGLLTIVRARVLSLGMVLAIGFLLLVSLTLTTALAALRGYVLRHFEGMVGMFASLDFLLSVGLGTGLVAHQLSNASATYGTFGAVIGIVAFLLLLAKISMYAAELNPVLARKLYPRALPMIDDLTDADRRVLGDLVHAERRREDQAIGVGFGDRAAEQAADDAAKHADSRAADG